MEAESNAPLAVDVCHLSVLNPVDHSRVYHRQARALALAGLRVHIVGLRRADAAPLADGITCTEFSPIHRLSWARRRRPKEVIAAALQQRARCYVLHSPELLKWASALAATGARVLYDVHEDYYKNILYGQTSHYGPRPVRWLLAQWIRSRENRAAKRYLSGLMLAEACYIGMIKAPPHCPETWVPNAFGSPSSESLAHFQTLAAQQLAATDWPSGMPVLLHSGTLAKRWGTEAALTLWERLNETQAVGLVMAGWSPDEAYVQRLLAIAGRSRHAERFLLIGGTQFVPYPLLVAWQLQATAELALYTPNPALTGRIPSKVWACGALGVPIILSNESWRRYLAAPQQAFVLHSPLDNTTDLQALLEWLRLQTSQKPYAPNLEAAWPHWAYEYVGFVREQMQASQSND